MRRARNLPWSYVYLAVACVVVALGFATWSVFKSLTEETYRAESRAELEVQMNILRSRVENDVRAGSHVTHGLTAAIRSEPDLPQDRFRAIAGYFLSVYPELRNIAAAPDLVIRYMVPLDGNEGAMGLDYRQVPAQLPAVMRAIEEHGIVMAGPVDLVQGGKGFIIRAPVFVPSDETGEEKLWGIISTVVDVEAFFFRVGLLDPKSYDVSIRGKDGRGAAGEVFFGRAEVFDQDPVLSSFSVPSGSWQVAMIPHGGWPTMPPALVHAQGLFILGGLLALALALGVTRLVHLRLKSDLQLASAINSMEDGVAYFDADERFVSCNDRYLEFNGPTSELFRTGRKFEAIMREGLARGQYPDAVGREEEFIAERLAVFRNPGLSIEQRQSDGRWIKIGESRTPDGGVVGIHVDITELKNAREEAERASRAKTDFLNVISHELRTPLTVILGFATFLSKPTLLPSVRNVKARIAARDLTIEEGAELFEKTLEEVENYGGKISRSGQHLLSLINDMLDLSKIEADKMDIAVGPVAVEPVIEGIVEEFQCNASDKGVALIANITDGVVLADELRLRQILMNLVGNAMKFTEHGSVTISTEVDEDRVVFRVTDTGTGIPEHALSEIFDRFSQVDTSTTRRAGGTGLGLAITKRFTELQGGEIGVSSEMGKGSTFWFWLPRADVGAATTSEG